MLNYIKNGIIGNNYFEAEMPSQFAQLSLNCCIISYHHVQFKHAKGLF